MKKNLLILFLCFIYFNLIAEISLPNLETNVNKNLIKVADEAIPEFSKIEQAVTKKETEKESLAPIVPPNYIPVIIEDKKPAEKLEAQPKEKDLNLQIQIESFHPGSLQTKFILEKENEKLPFAFGFNHSSLFTLNSRTILNPYAKLSYEGIKNLQVGFGVAYYAQILDISNLSFHRFNFDLEASYEISFYEKKLEALKIYASDTVLFFQNKFLSPFKIGIVFKSSVFDIDVCGGLHSQIADVIMLARKNSNFVFNDEVAEETSWFGKVNAKFKLNDFFDFKAGIEFMTSAFDSGFLTPNYETNEISILKRCQLNSLIGFVSQMDKLHFEILFKAFWLEKNFINIPFELNFNIEYEFSKKIKINLYAYDMFYLFAGESGGFGLSAKYKF